MCLFVKEISFQQLVDWFSVELNENTTIELFMKLPMVVERKSGDIFFGRYESAKLGHFAKISSVPTSFQVVSIHSFVTGCTQGER